MAIFDKARMFLVFQGHNWSKSIQEGTQRGGQPQLILPEQVNIFLEIFQLFYSFCLEVQKPIQNLGGW